MGDLFDPFGAQEFFCDGVHRERICTEIIRLSYFASEGEQRILKVKILMPMTAIIAEQQNLATFLTRMGGRVLM